MKSEKVWTSLLLTSSLLLSASAANAATVSYRDYDAATKTFTNAERECTLVTSETRILANGWYAVKDNVVIAETNLTITGDAHLILCDGASLTIASPTAGSAAIVVGASESLTIYGCENGTGQLDALGGSFSAGIGADGRHSCGTVTINGGIVSATGYSIGAAGIGGSAVSGTTACGTVTINGGMVTARGGSNAAGIGGGYHGAGGLVTINGGAIDAMGGSDAPEIGPGYGSTQGKVWINGGIFTTRPKDEWLATFRIVVENTDDATKVRYGHRVILNAVANAILQTTKIHVNKYGETYVEITGVQTNACGCMADAIAAANAVSMGSVELVTNVNETVRIAGEGAVSIDLKGYTWAPSPGEDDVIIYNGANSNLVLNVRNGTLLGNLRLGAEGGDETGGVLGLGPMLISDGDICVMGGDDCVLMSGFKSTYEKVYSTQVPLVAMEGAEFACNQSLEGGNETFVLSFPTSDLELVPTKGGTFRVGRAETPIDNKWSYDLDKWMKDLPEETQLGEICFPASHNAGASGDLDRWGLKGYLSAPMQFRTQDRDVNKQLNDGVRVLDLRFMCSDKEKKTIRSFHAPSVGEDFGMMGQSLNDILRNIDDFLKAHPSEVVIAELTHWGNQNGMNSAETQTKVLDVILTHPTLGYRVFKAKEGIVKRDDKTTWPILNDVQLKDLRGKVILAVEPAEGPDPIDPLSGIWGLKDWNHKEVKGGAVEFRNGYLTEFSDYAGVDDYGDMRKDQAEKWKDVSNWNKDAKNRLPICLSWTLTATFNWSIWSAAASKLVVLLSLVLFLVFAILTWSPCKIIAAKTTIGIVFGVDFLVALAGIVTEIFFQGGVGYKHVNIRKFADKLNPEMATFLNEGVETKKYNVPFSVFYDFVEPKYNKVIVDLNTHLVPYAAEVVNGNSHEVYKYERLNDAFTNMWLKIASNRCTVRLLRPEEPDKEDKYQYVVPSDTFFTFDLNGKLLRRPEDGADKGVPILVNNGTIEIVSTQPGGGFDGRGQWLKKSFKGAAILNAGSLTAKGILFSGFDGTGAEGVIYNGGELLALEKVSVSSVWISGVVQGTGGQRTVLTDCNLTTAAVVPCRGSDGMIEMSGGCICSSPIPIAVSVGGSCWFEMKSGEIVSGMIHVADSAKVTIYDGFVKGVEGKSGSGVCFDVPSGKSAEDIRVYSGCFGYEIPKKYIAKGKCEYVGTYSRYPYEVVPCDPDGNLEIAWVVETKKKYPSVQAAIDAVEAAGGFQTIELLNPTHPVKTLEFPENVPMTLDLKGYRITKLGPEEPVIRNRGTLTLVDSSTNAAGVVAVYGLTNGCKRAAAGGIVLNEGSFTLKGGVLCDAGAKRGGGIFNATNGCCFIDGGTVLACQASEKGGGICNEGLLVQRGGVIADCTAGTQGGGVWNGGSATCLDGAIVGCSAATAGGIVNENEYALFGGVISNVTADVGAEAILADGISLTTLCGVSVKESIGKAQRWSSVTKIRIYEGLFGQYPEATWIQDGSKCVANEDEATNLDFPHRVMSEAVAQIGQMKYPTLQAAFDATAQGSDEVPVKLLKPVARENVVLRDGCKAALDLAGLWVLSTKDALTVSTNAQLRIADSVGGGKVGFLFPTNLAETCAVRNYGTCRIEGGRYNDVVLKMDSARTMSVKAGLFTYHPDTSWIDPGSRLKVNDDPTTCLEYGFVVESQNVARFKDDPDGDERMTLARAFRSEKLVGGGALRTIQLAENAEEVAVTVPAGRRGVLDLCGRWLRGKAHEPIITVEKGASLVIVDSVGGGLIMKDDVHLQDRELRGAIVNCGELELAGGAISNCFSYAEAGGVYNAKGARFVMSGGRIVGCGMLEDKQRDRAAGVCNKGEFWMTGGEIVDCEAANGVMGVYNGEDAVFRQLGGRIEDCLNNAELGACVRNAGDYVLVDGRIADSSAGVSNKVYCIDNSLDATFVQAYGEVSANLFGYPIGSSSGRSSSDVRIGNGKITGVFHNAKGTINGGFFTTDKIIADNPNMRIPSVICALTENGDIVTSGDYPYCVRKMFEAEIQLSNSFTQTLHRCSTLAAALGDNRYVLDFRHNYGRFPTNITVRLLMDVKDCVECIVIPDPDYPEIPVTLDLNGFSLTGTGANRTLPGRCDPVIENHRHLRIIDSSAGKMGFIAMSGSCEPAWDGGGIRNAGYLELDGVTIFGCRADRGGAVFNAKDGTVRMKNVRLLGCWAGNDAGGDCIFNAGDCELDDCELDLWPDARDPDNVRRGNAIVNSGSLKIGSRSQNRNNDGRIRGGIANECDELAGTIDVSYGLFEQKPNDDWLSTAPNQAWCLKTSDEEMRRDYPWTVTSGRKDVLVDYDSQNMMIKSIRAVLRSDDAVVYSEDVDLEDAADGAGRLHVPVPNGGSIIIEVLYTDEFGGMHPITREFSVDSSLSLHLDKSAFFEAESVTDNHAALFPTLAEALQAGVEQVTLLRNVEDVSDSYCVQEGKKVVFDLNGFSVIGTGKAPLFVNEGTLTIRDGSPRGTGRLTNSSEFKWLIECGGAVLNYGVFTLESGTIENCTAGDYGGGIMGVEHSETYIRGGRILNCQAEVGSAICSRGRFEMTGGAVREPMKFMRSPSNSTDSEGDALVSGGLLGCVPDDYGILSPTAELKDNTDDATRDDYPFQVVDHAACDPIYDVVRVDQTYFTTNSTVLAANRIYRFVEDVTLTGSTSDPTLASALSVTGGTTVLYIDAGVTVALTGSVAEAQSGAGLRVPQFSRAIIAGGGTLLAQGGASTAGADGQDGEAPGTLYAGRGGAGGHGGTGAAAAIGGIGGFGGAGGNGDVGAFSEDPGQHLKGKAGAAGGDGQPGEDMGMVIALGAVKIKAMTYLEAASGGIGGVAGISSGSRGGGGGGGGGGSGGLPIYAIGGGAGGGSGGGGGGGGDFAGWSGREVHSGSSGGCGRGGDRNGNDGRLATGVDMDSGVGDLSLEDLLAAGQDTGLGGASGAAGLCGESEGFYAGEEVKVDCGGLYGSNFVARSISQHGALRRQMIILDEDDVEICRVEACHDMPLPEITWALLGPKESIRGLFQVNGDGSEGAMWYDGDLSPKRDRYEADDLGDVTLKVRHGTIVAILSKGAEDERMFATLAAAVDEAEYGDTISIVGDVHGENVKVPIGITIVVEPPIENFRAPTEEDLRHKYYKVTKHEEDGKTYYKYGLDEEMVVPRFGASDGAPAMEFVRDDEGKVMSVKLNVENVYEDLYYILYWGLSPLPEEMMPVTWECADEDGTIRLEAPADETSGFYRIRVTDHFDWLGW